MISKKFLFLLTGLVLAWLAVLVFFPKKDEISRNEKEIVIMSYSSFVQPWGPGPLIQQEFKKKYGIDIKWIDAGNAGLILERLRFKFNSERPDLIIGLDQLALEEARKIIAWKTLDTQDLSKKKIEDLPSDSIFFDFMPFDWSPMVFVTQKNYPLKPSQLSDFLQDAYKGSLALQDPRSSAPGLQFLFWIISVYGEKQGFEFLKKLKPSIHSLSPSWSVSYSLFKAGQAPFVFSYISSPLYHLIEEKNDNFSAIATQEALPLQIEYFGIPHLCMNCEGARQFANFLMSKSAQEIIMRKNYMWPVIGGVREGTEFEPKQKYHYIDSFKYMNWSKEKMRYLNEWKKLEL